MTKTVRVRLKESGDRSYDIIFGKSLPRIAQEIAASKSGGPVFIITDEHVAPLYGDLLLHELCRRSVRCEQITVPAGEQSKRRKLKDTIEDHLIELDANRQSTIIALGGGVVGDLAGFVAATLFRGIPYIQIPTSLLAQVDSSVGGKVAVDHPAGKNLIGAFHQPQKVYISVNFLSTLPDREFRCGMAEVIKYAAIMDKEFFTFLEKRRGDILKRTPGVLQDVVSRCCALKARIVGKDERENGLRRILNFGHTIGHAVELLSKFSISHGEAVSIGMAAECTIAESLGIFPAKDAVRLRNLLISYDLPVLFPEFLKISDIVSATLRDKKMQHGNIQYTLLRKLGTAAVGVSVEANNVIQFLNQYIRR